MKFLVLVVLAICAFAHTEAYTRRELEAEDKQIRSEQAEEYSKNEETEEEKNQQARLKANNAIIANFIQYIEDFRTVITNGDANFPVMDPLFIPSIGPFAYTKMGVPVEVNLYNLKVEGLRQFIVKYVLMNSEQKLLYGEVNIPWLYLTGTYECTASIMPVITQSSSGNFTLSIIDIDVYAELYLGMLPDGHGTSLEGITINISVKNTTGLLSDVDGSLVLNNMLNNYLQKSADNNLREEISQLSETVVQHITPIASEFLSGITIHDTPPE